VGRRVAGIVAALLLLLGTAFGGRALRTSEPPRLLPVPLISQARPWSCGAASLMAALVYFSVFDEAESVLDADLHVNPDEGTSVESIVSEARRFGLKAAARTELTLDDVGRELSRGAVVIAAIQAWPTGKIADWRTDWEDGHYVVVVGLSSDRIYLMDPSVRTGYAYLDRNDFLTRWHDYDVDGSRRIVWNRLGIVIQGDRPIRRYPADPTPIQ
jgi:ABC-type bacteriocin/lantibiotic exporter with double-glycine peptidase domain